MKKLTFSKSVLARYLAKLMFTQKFKFIYSTDFFCYFEVKKEKFKLFACPSRPTAAEKIVQQYAVVDIGVVSVSGACRDQTLQALCRQQRALY